LAPNPALPKDQPLRGRWRKVDAVFTPNSHQSCQSLLGSWFNADVFLLQIRINHSNCYAVDGSMQMLFLLPTHINHANRYAVVGSMQMLFLLPTRINHANRYAVVGSMQMLFLLPTRINHANRYAVVSAINVVYDLYLLNRYGFLS